MDLFGSLYIYDASNYRVLKWLQNEPLGSVIAGGRGSGSTLDKISFGYGIYVDNQGRLYVSDYSNHRVMRWDNETAGIIVRFSFFLFFYVFNKSFLLNLGGRNWYSWYSINTITKSMGNLC